MVLLGIHQSLLWFCWESTSLYYGFVGNPPVFIMVLLGIHQSLLWFCWESTNLSVRCRYALACGPDMAPTIRPLDTECSDWLMLLGQWAAPNPVCRQPGTLCVCVARTALCAKNTPGFALYTMSKITPCIMWKITPCIMWKITACIPAKTAVMHVS